MSQPLTKALRIIVILGVIALTGIEIISNNPELAWIYLILTALVLAVVLIRERPWIREEPRSG